MRSREECEKQRSRGRRRREVGLSNQNRPRLAEGGPYSPRDAREHHPLDVQAAVAALGRPRCVLQPHAPIGPFSLTPISHVDAPSRSSIDPFPPIHAHSPHAGLQHASGLPWHVSSFASSLSRPMTSSPSDPVGPVSSSPPAAAVSDLPAAAAPSASAPQASSPMQQPLKQQQLRPDDGFSTGARKVVRLGGGSGGGMRRGGGGPNGLPMMHGVVHVCNSSNNCILTLTDTSGQVSGEPGLAVLGC